jgi:ethanolamine utilization protein EutM
MVKNALGLIETIGLVAAVTAADAAVKTANVELAGYELSRGGGLVVVKVFGDVGAVKAAVDGARVAASKVGTVWATHVIPRPHSELSGILLTSETVGLDKPFCLKSTVAVEPVKVAVNPLDTQPTVAEPKPVVAEKKLVADAAESASEVDEKSAGAATLVPQSKSTVASCNLCLDPACGRKKGDPKVNCIHYDQNNKEES